MKVCARFALVLAMAFAAVAAVPAYCQNVLTYRYNNSRNGLQTEEKILTPANVNVNSFGKLFTLPADGLVDAQPLYVAAMNIAGGTHNVVIVATENDSVYAYDADTGANYWQVTTLAAGEAASDDRGCSQVTPEIGITSTPVIHRASSSSAVIYVVAMSKDSSGNYHQRLHALNAATGAEMYGGPIEVTGQYPGTGDNSSGGYVIFDPAQYKERSGLLFYNGTVYLTWASHCDARPYTGWIMAYSATKLTQTSILNVTPNGNEGAVWGSGAGLTMDGEGNIFLLVANGVFDTTLNSSGFPSSGDYGNAFLRVNTKGGLSVADYFEMTDQGFENDNDIDLGSGGALLINTKDSGGHEWQLAAGAGKDENLYLVNRNGMGGYNATSDNIYQEIDGVLPGGMWNSPAMFNSRVYYGPVGSPILAFQMENAKLSTTPVEQSTNSFGFPGATLTISSNDGSEGIVWAVENTSPATLHAYSAKLVEIYNSNQAANGRDNFGSGNKYAAPIVANGKVYVPTANGVGVLGLLSATTK